MHTLHNYYGSDYCKETIDSRQLNKAALAPDGSFGIQAHGQAAALSKHFSGLGGRSSDSALPCTLGHYSEALGT